MDFIMQREAPFSGNEYWFKFFPLYKQTGSLRWVHFDNIELNTATMRSSLVHPNSKIETSEIKRTANPYGWLALGGTVMTAVAAATYGYLKWFKSDAK
jgi:hypothetical protein